MGVAHVTLFTCISPSWGCYSDFTLAPGLSPSLLLPSASPSFSHFFLLLPPVSFSFLKEIRLRSWEDAIVGPSRGASVLGWRRRTGPAGVELEAGTDPHPRRLCNGLFCLQL